ncbi:MAG: M12 family metallo-peptidase [Gilvibacter sp.]
MKKLITLLFLIPLIGISQNNSLGQIAKEIEAAKAQQGAFPSYDLFNSQTKSASENYSTGVEAGIVMTIDGQLLQSLRTDKPEKLKLNLPFYEDGSSISVELIATEVYSPTFKALTSDGTDITKTVDFGIHYRGIIAGNSNSLVSISVFQNQVSGFIADQNGNFTLGKLQDSELDHIIYPDSSIKTTFDFNCGTVDDGVGYTAEQLSMPESIDPGDIVDIYVEAGSTVYESFGGDLASSVAFLSGVFAQCYVLYANDGIAARTSSMLVWTFTDPYTSSSSSTKLNQFRGNTPPDGFDGDLGHLVEVQNIGGIASGFSGICAPNTDDSLCFSGFAGTSFSSVPTYSFNVFLIAHEMGHLLGSRHTHACVWNGDNTAIDSCSGFTEGSCPLPGLPADGGTIMSYCSSTSAGVDFTLGFGPQPTAVILNNIDATGNCLNPAGDNPPVAVCQTIEVELGTDGTATITVDDLDAGSYDDVAVVTRAIDIDSFDCDDIGDNRVMLTVTDGDGLTNSCIAIVRVLDTLDPVITDCPGDLEVTEEVSYTLPDFTGDLVVDDNCADINITQSPTPGTVLGDGTYTVTFNVTDAGGNTVSCDFELIVNIILGVGDPELAGSLVLYPNPAQDFIKLTNPQNLELQEVAIYDITGKLMGRMDLREMTDDITMDVSRLDSAVYFVIIKDEFNQIVRRIVKK